MQPAIKQAQWLFPLPYPQVPVIFGRAKKGAAVHMSALLNNGTDERRNKSFFLSFVLCLY